jgi:uncharacterized repeat protein (TIGR03847 family)
MPYTEIELSPVDFITIGTVGPKGRREFNLQAGKDTQIVTLTIEKEQARRIGEALEEMLADLNKRFPVPGARKIDLKEWNMELREPVEPRFRVAQIGLGYDQNQDLMILVAQELLVPAEDEDPELLQPSIVRLWGTRDQYAALSLHTLNVVEAGRADPRHNGHLIHYWT